MADRKAAFRAKLNQRQQNKRIESPLVRYNENDRPVCRVCEVVLKSDSDWLPHEASRKHKEAINNLKASALKKRANDNENSEATGKRPRHQVGDSQKMDDAGPRKSSIVPAPKNTGAVPAGFFDKPGTGSQKQAPVKVQQAETSAGARPSKMASSSQVEVQPRKIAEIRATGNKQNNGALPGGPVDDKQAGTKQGKGALPEGFFDNKEADLRARGIEPVKPDIKDEYKEFEKLIQEDLVEVDNRLEEEEVDAAEMIEEEEMVEQRTYRERVELLKKMKQDLSAAKSAKAGKVSETNVTKSKLDESSSEEDDDDSFALNWRAQHQ